MPSGSVMLVRLRPNRCRGAVVSDKLMSLAAPSGAAPAMHHFTILRSNSYASNEMRCISAVIGTGTIYAVLGADRNLRRMFLCVTLP